MNAKSIIKEFKGYYTKDDETSIDPSYLVNGSQNVLLDEKGILRTRKGYTALSVHDLTSGGVLSSHKFTNRAGIEIILYSVYDGTNYTLNFYTTNYGHKTILLDGAYWPASDFSFAEFWNTTELIPELLMVCGNDKIYSWTGALAIVSTATVNTITKTGTATWAQSGFLTAGTRKVIINGTEYTYTGGETTTTLTGVTPDPSALSGSAEVVYQSPRTNDNKPTDTFVNDVIAVMNNQVYVGSHESSRLYISMQDNYADFSYSSPRAAGDGAILTQPDVNRALIAGKENMYVFSGNDYIGKVVFGELAVGAVIVETVDLIMIKNPPRCTPIWRNAICNASDHVAFISNDKKLYLLGAFENLEGINLKDMSESIQPDFDNADFSSSHMIWHKNRLYIADAVNDKVYILERKSDDTWFWQAPQVIPAGRFEVFEGNLYFGSSTTDELYRMFYGVNDAGRSFKAVAKFAYNNFGNKSVYKIFDEHFLEGYITQNTILNKKLYFDYKGYAQTLEYEIDGSDSNIVEIFEEEGILGDGTLGDSALGGGWSDTTEIPQNKFRVIFEMPPQDFFEYQLELWTDETDYQWAITGFGSNARMSTNKPTSIKK